MSLNYFILDENNNPINTESIVSWSCWMLTFNRFIKTTILGDVKISTEYLGIGIDYKLIPAPLLWKTTIHSKKNGQIWERLNASHKFALHSHRHAIKVVIKELRCKFPKKK